MILEMCIVGLIALSTCIQRLESALDISTSHWESRDFPLVNGGMQNVVPRIAKSSDLSKPHH